MVTAASHHDGHLGDGMAEDEELAPEAQATEVEDPHNVRFLTLTLEVEGEPPVTQSLRPGDLESLEKPFNVPESSRYRFTVGFLVQHTTVSGLRWRTKVSRMGTRIWKDDETLGTFIQQEEAHLAPSPHQGWKEVSSGIMVRGHHDVEAQFVDDAGTILAVFKYSFDIVRRMDE